MSVRIVEPSGKGFTSQTRNEFEIFEGKVTKPFLLAVDTRKQEPDKELPTCPKFIISGRFAT